METKHTPGPWDLQHSQSRVVVGKIGREWRSVAVASDLPCIGGHGDVAAQAAADQERANARLIAAAPRMFDRIAKLAAEGDAEAISIMEAVNGRS